MNISFAQNYYMGKVEILSESMASINILNLNTKEGTTNDLDGNFILPANIGDTILFSAVHIFKKKIILKAKDFTKEINYTPLIPKSFLLQEIELVDGLSMYKKPISKEVIENINLNLPFKNNPLPKTVEQKELDYSSSNMIFSLFTSGSKRLENLRKYIHLDAQLSQRDQLKKYLGQDFFKILKVKEDKIDYFIDYCSYDEDFYFLLKNKDYVELIQLMKSRKIGFDMLLEKEDRNKNE